jgi:hypothetical protein
MTQEVVRQEDVEMERWNAFLAALTGGKAIHEAMGAARVTRADIERMTLSEPTQAQRFLEACAARQRRTWTILDYAEVCQRHAEGATVTDAVVAVRGADEVAQFFQLASDPGLKPHFEAAKRAAMDKEMENLLAIADDTSRDVLQQDKGPAGNVAAVTRDKLRIETRMKIAGAYDDRWAEKKGPAVSVHITNHAQVLEEARARAKTRDRRISRTEKSNAVDAAFTVVPPGEYVEATGSRADPEPSRDPDVLRKVAAVQEEAGAQDPDTLRAAAAVEVDSASQEPDTLRAAAAAEMEEPAEQNPFSGLDD